MGEILRENRITYRYILGITYPIILSMFSMNLMVFVDRAFVAQYDLIEFAASVPAGNAATAVANLFIGMIAFVSTLISQYYGAKEYDRCSSSMWQGIYLSLIFSVMLLLLSPWMSQLFELMGHSGELLHYEKRFFHLIIISSCIQLLGNAVSGLYRGVGDTKMIMISAIAGNICNIVLDWLLIFGKFGFPEMGGIHGAGTATILSCLLSLLIYLAMLFRPKYKNQFSSLKNFKPQQETIFKIVRYGFPAGVQAFVQTGYFSLLLLIIGGIGEVSLSAANIVFTIEGLSIFPVLGLGTAIGIIAAQERGARRTDLVPLVLRKGIMLGIVFSAFIILLFNILPVTLISIFQGDTNVEMFEQIKKMAIPLVRLTSIWIAFDTIHIIISNILKSMGDTYFIMVIYLAMPILFYIVLPYWICVVQGKSLQWVWWDLLLYTFLMLALVAVRFKSNKWRGINIIEERKLEMQ
ncbi:Multidrug resistance protein NorM [compost metagenome]